MWLQLQAQFLNYIRWDNVGWCSTINCKSTCATLPLQLYRCRSFEEELLVAIVTWFNRRGSLDTYSSSSSLSLGSEARMMSLYSISYLNFLLVTIVITMQTLIEKHPYPWQEKHWMGLETNGLDIIIKCREGNRLNCSVFVKSSMEVGNG